MFGKSIIKYMFVTSQTAWALYGQASRAISTG